MKEELANEASIMVPDIFTTDEVVAEDEDVKLEWTDSDHMGHPYVLTLMSEDGIGKGVDMLIGLVNYERKTLDKVMS